MANQTLDKFLRHADVTNHNQKNGIQRESETQPGCSSSITYSTQSEEGLAM
jgi:hypothetical protein